MHWVGNDIWAMVVIAQETPDSPVAISPLEPDMEQLLTEYVDVFAEPKTVTPHQLYDQALTLEPGHRPPNSRLCHYSPQQKDEIEHQVAEMIVAGIVNDSMSPCSSPVLLVKQGSSWRFCVNYRKLNEVTIKNKFPLPIVNELLDELASSKFFSKLDLRASYHQIRMHASGEDKTAFKTHSSHFQIQQCRLDPETRRLCFSS